MGEFYLNKARILIVEDEAVVAENLEKVITDCGYEVVGRAASADDAVNAAIELNPDLILMDIVLLGEKNGIDASYEIKEKIDIPIIFLTAYSNLELIDKAKSVEPYAYIVKPFQDRQLFASIEMALYRIQMAKKLKESEERYHRMVANVPGMVFQFVLHPDGSMAFPFVSESCRELFGIGYMELMRDANVLLDIIHPDDRPGFYRSVADSAKSLLPWEWDGRAVVSGEERWFRCISRPEQQADGDVLWDGLVIEVTEQKQAEESLRESELRYRSVTDDVLDTSSVGIFILDSDFHVVWINQALERYFGLRREEIIGKDKRQLLRERIKDIFEDPVSFAEKVFATYDDNTYIERFECHIVPGSEREERWLEHWSQPILSGLYAGGRVEHYSDITERKVAEKRIEEEYHRAEFYIDLMSHDINNINQITRGYLELLLKMPELPSKSRKYTETALDHVRKSADIIHNVKALSTVRSGELEIGGIDIYPAFASAVATAKSQSRDVRINSNIIEGRYFIRGNALLFDVFSNLLNNAAKFDGHDIVEIDVDISSQDGDWRLEFKDRGPGIGDGYKKIIFNRLEQAGESTQGTGLGLTIVKYIVESYGGKVWVEDRVEGDRTQGSNFILLLPQGD